MWAKIYRRDRRNHASLNSAQTEAAMAGALEVQLAGNAYYFGKLYEKPTIGDGIRPVEVEDIRRSKSSALCNSDPGGCDISSDRKRGAILFLFIIP